MEPSYPFETTRCTLQAKFPQKPYKSFMDPDFVPVHKHAKKELGEQQQPFLFTLKNYKYKYNYK